MVSPMLKYVWYMMQISGISQLCFIKRHKTLYSVYRCWVQTILVLGLILQYGALPNFHGSAQNFIKVLHDLCIMTTVYLKGIVCMSGNMANLIVNLVDYELKLADNTDAKIVRVYQQTAGKSQFIQLFYIASLYILTTSFIVPGYVNYLLLSKQADNSTSIVQKSFPYYWWFPFDEDEHYLLSLVLQSYFTIVATNGYCFVLIIMVILPLSIILRLQVLIINLKNINTASEEGVSEIQMMIKDCIEEHIDTIRNCILLNDTVKYVMLWEFLAASFQLSLTFFETKMITQPGALVFPVLFILQTLMQLLILYWHANEIREESVKVADAAFNLPWYKYNKSAATNIRIMIMRSQKPLTLTVGPFGNMTLEMFVKIIKAVYTYITFMQHAYEEK